MGVDMSFTGGRAVPVSWFRSRIAEGVQVFLQCAWTGGYAGVSGIRAVARGNLFNAREAGGLIGAYYNANPWFTPETSLGEAQTALGDMFDHIPVLETDLEIQGTTVEQALAHYRLAESVGKRSAFYSARWFGVYVDFYDLRLAGTKYHSAKYDFDPDLDYLDEPYGIWGRGDLIGEQYQGSTQLEGVDVDLDVFDQDFFTEGGDNMPTIEEIEQAVRRQLGTGEFSSDPDDTALRFVRRHTDPDNAVDPVTGQSIPSSLLRPPTKTIFRRLDTIEETLAEIKQALSGDGDRKST